MQKKLFSLLTLLLCLCSGAWADDPTVTVTWFPSTMTSSTFSVSGTASVDGLMTVSNATHSSPVSDPEFRSKNSVNWAKFTSTNVNVNGKNANRWLATDYITFSVKIADGVTFTPTKATATVAGSGTGGCNAGLFASKQSSAQSGQSSGIAKEENGGQDYTLTSFSKASFSGGETLTFYIHIGIPSGKAISVNNVVLQGTYVESPKTTASTPTFNPDGGDVNGATTIAVAGEAVHTYYQWSDTEVTLTKDSEGWTEGTSVTVPNVTATKYLYAYASNGTGYESAVVSKTFNITKVKLANGLAYTTAAVTKKVGDAAFTNALTNPNSLEVTYSIADGATATGTTVNETTGEVTLGETAGTATIKASFAGNDDYVAGEVSYTLTLKAAIVQTEVTGNKTWDIENNVSCDDDRNTNNEYMLYGNIEGLTFTEPFDATSLLVKASTANTAYRQQYKCAQGASLKFHTTVPGLVTVTFSSPGDEARTLRVNGNDVFTSSARATASWYVEAGDVEMTGNKSIRIFKIEFATVDVSNVNLNVSGYATFSTNYPVEVSGAKAYTAALDYANEKITCTEVSGGKVPAGAGVLLFGEPNAEVTLTPTTGATALAGNNLKGTTQANGILATKGNNNYYVLSGDTFKKFTGENFAANKAYFEVDGENNVLARGFNIVFVDEATVINEVGNTEQEAEGYYNLSGQRIAQPTNGLYIVNGKKVIIK